MAAAMRNHAFAVGYYARPVKSETTHCLDARTDACMRSVLAYSLSWHSCTVEDYAGDIAFY